LSAERFPFTRKHESECDAAEAVPDCAFSAVLAANRNAASDLLHPAVGDEEHCPSHLVGSRLAAGTGFETRGWFGYSFRTVAIELVCVVWRRRLRSDVGCG
jgi:hypothetical protein